MSSQILIVHKCKMVMYEGYEQVQEVSREFKNFQEDLIRYKKVQGTRRFKVQDGSRMCKGHLSWVKQVKRFRMFTKVSKGLRRFKKVQEDSRRFKKVQNGSRRFMKL